MWQRIRKKYHDGADARHGRGAGSRAKGALPVSAVLIPAGYALHLRGEEGIPQQGAHCGRFSLSVHCPEYEEAGAAAISVLTEPPGFWAATPICRRDRSPGGHSGIAQRFYGGCLPDLPGEGTGGGGGAAHLCSAGYREIREDLAICRSLGINAIVEAHDAAEVSSAVNAGADIIGVNNRNLKDFTVDIHNGLRLRSLVPEDVLFIAEAG